MTIFVQITANFTYFVQKQLLLQSRCLALSNNILLSLPSTYLKTLLRAPNLVLFILIFQYYMLSLLFSTASHNHQSQSTEEIQELHTSLHCNKIFEVSMQAYLTQQYFLLFFRCPRDSTYRSLPSPTNNVVRFQFNSFKFLNQHNSVYIQCKLVVCRADDRSSRCHQGCLLRKKRGVDESQEKVNVVVGPLKLLKDENKVQK